jgi:hypothetical protein
MDNRISEQKTAEKAEPKTSTQNTRLETAFEASAIDNISQSQSGQWCPNCGAFSKRANANCFATRPDADIS